MLLAAPANLCLKENGFIGANLKSQTRYITDCHIKGRDDAYALARDIYNTALPAIKCVIKLNLSGTAYRNSHTLVKRAIQTVSFIFLIGPICLIKIVHSVEHIFLPGGHFLMEIAFIPHKIVQFF